MEDIQVTGKFKAQFIKDLSFEMRDPTQVVKHSQGQTDVKPEVKLDVNVSARKVGEGTGENKGKTLFEVVIETKAKGGVKEEEIFVVELAYAGIFELDNVSPEAQEKFCLTDAPTMLFPFVSRIISDVTRDGGILPIRLEPINFFTLYIKSKQQQNEVVN